MTRARVAGVRAACLTCVLALGCGEPTLDLLVDVRTDYVPGIEFVRVRTTLGEGAPEEQPAIATDDFVSGQRVAAFDQLAPASRTITVTLVDGQGAPLAEREVLVQHDEDRVATVVITRDCRDVSCPGEGDAPEATSCLGGRCVAPECVEGSEASCGEAECAADDDCDEPAPACAFARCAGGVCLAVGDDAMCPGSEFCRADVGCTAVPGGEDCPRRLGAGRLHNCLLTYDGRVLCQGDNEFGQLGDGTNDDSVAPVPTMLDGPAIDVMGGRYNTCAARDDGTVWCWGENANDQLGDGTGVDSSVPVQAVGVADAVEVAVAAIHACARTDAGEVLCWGAGEGRVGAGSLGGSSTPVPALVADVARLEAGGSHTCALHEDRTVSCWGRNDDGQLGDGTTTNDGTPGPVAGLSEAVALSVRDGHSCAVRADGSVWCWGENTAGELGDGTTTNRSTPVEISALSDVVAVAAGADHTCALTGAGEVWCWGANDSGQIGDGTRTRRLSPVRVTGLDRVLQISSAAFNTCARRDDQTMWCWGQNDDGQLGDGTTTSRDVPVMVRYPCGP